MLDFRGGRVQFAGSAFGRVAVHVAVGPGRIHVPHGLRAAREGLDDGDRHFTRYDAGRFTVGDIGARSVVPGRLNEY